MTTAASALRRRAWLAGLLLLSMSVLACRERVPPPEAAGIPSHYPDRLVQSFDGDPATGRSVSWRTSADVERAVGQIAIAFGEPTFSRAARTVRGRSERVELTVSDWNEGLPFEEVSYHSVSFTDLEPDTLYAYRVGDGEHWSEWVHFRTAATEAQPFRFLYFGDAQNGILSHWSRVVRAAYAAAPDAAFLLHAGDLVDDGHYDADWAQWFQAGGWIHAAVPSVPVTGNHEYRHLDRARRQDRRLSILWRPQFALPVTEELPNELHETAYAFSYQGARVFVLDSNRMHEEQASWLDDALGRSDERWRIVTFHHPIFSAGEDRDNDELRALWLPVLERHEVDLVLQGHDHSYARGHVPARTVRGTGAASVTDEAGGSGEVSTVFALSVSGAKQYELAPEVWYGFRELIELDRSAENSQFYQVIEVTPERLSYAAYTAVGELYDAFELHKDAAGRKTLIDDPAVAGPPRRFETTVPYEGDFWREDEPALPAVVVPPSRESESATEPVLEEAAATGSS